MVHGDTFTASSATRDRKALDHTQDAPARECPRTDDEVRALLARQPQSETLPHPAATVAILQRHVEDATDDVYAVERWIAARAGERRIGPAAKSVSHRIGNGYPRWDGPFRYYVIPADALRQP